MDEWIVTHSPVNSRSVLVGGASVWEELSSTALAKCINLRSGSDPVQLMADSSMFSG